MLGDFKGILCDLDGVLCVGNNPISGASEIIQFIKKNKIPFRIATNFTTLSRESLAFKMNSMGIDIVKEDIISAAYAGVLKLR
mgnify:CR=1 FL=1